MVTFEKHRVPIWKLGIAKQLALKKFLFVCQNSRALVVNSTWSTCHVAIMNVSLVAVKLFEWFLDKYGISPIRDLLTPNKRMDLHHPHRQGQVLEISPPCNDPMWQKLSLLQWTLELEITYLHFSQNSNKLSVDLFCFIQTCNLSCGWISYFQPESKEISLEKLRYFLGKYGLKYLTCKSCYPNNKRRVAAAKKWTLVFHWCPKK